MIYGHDKTIHRTQGLNVEVDQHGRVVSVWFRCCALPFDVTIVGSDRAVEMEQMSRRVNAEYKLNAVDIDRVKS